MFICKLFNKTGRFIYRINYSLGMTIPNETGLSPTKQVAWLIKAYYNLQSDGYVDRRSVFPYIGDGGHDDLREETDNEVDLFFAIKGKLDKGVEPAKPGETGTICIDQKIIDHGKECGFIADEFTIDGMHSFITDNGFYESLDDPRIQEFDTYPEDIFTRYLMMAHAELARPRRNHTKIGLAFHRIGLYDRWKVARSRTAHDPGALHDLVNVYIDAHDILLRKMLYSENLVPVIEEKKRNGMKVGMTNGVFDLFHKGHAQYLAQARQYCDYLLIALNSDASTRKLKGPDRPINDERERAALLASLTCVDGVTIFDDERATAIIEAVHPDIYFKGGDYRYDGVTDDSSSGKPHLDREEVEMIERLKIKVEILPLQPKYKSSRIITTISERHSLREKPL